MSQDMPLTIQPVFGVRTESTWLPIESDSLYAFLESAPEESRDALRRSALEILSEGASPERPGVRRTGLVVGYVQSGKTLSFESVVALAQDNGFAVVIVIAGTGTNLLDQSARRLRRHLGIDQGDRPRRWVHLNNPNRSPQTLQTIRNVLEDWRDAATPPEDRRTVLVTVLKNHTHLANLADLVRELSPSDTTVLIVDDEADQASLNNEARTDSESTTYRRLMELRSLLPNHTYLQYTATPQAPLLVSIADTLSPDFVHVLDPGADYVGGLEFFDDSSTLVRVIPDSELPDNPDRPHEPPDSLLVAMQLYLVGVALGLLGRESGNRSMLVHPSRLVEQHNDYYLWVHNVLEEWKRTLALPESDPDRQSLVRDFSSAYDDLLTTLPVGAPAFASVVDTLPRALRNTAIEKVNADRQPTPEIDWNASYGWILVGGQAMDRGYTIEGLTVTYMPRGIGVGNADTVQQRARFFGYKRPYLGYCRVYLEQSTVDAFQSYVQHEEDIRRQLKAVQRSARPLADWKRAFVLDPRLRPCRNSVLTFDYMRGEFSNSWFAPKIVLAPNELLDFNRHTVHSFVESLSLREDPASTGRTASQSHQLDDQVLLSDVVDRLLVGVRLPGTLDAQLNTGLLLQLGRALEANPGEVATVYVMSHGSTRIRSVDVEGKLGNLFQGPGEAGPDETTGARRYPGDRRIHHQDRVTIQIHLLRLLDQAGSTLAEDVPVVAVWVPRRLGEGWVVQDQPTTLE